jgi:hypothetical protein
MKNLLAFIFACLLAGGAWAQTSMVTFNVNMSNETVSEAGVFLGGGVIGGHDAYQLSDTDGDGTYSVTVELANGTVGNYIFLNGNCPDWSCKEDLAGLPCADGTWNDRFLPEVTGDATYSTCFGQCSEDGSCEAPPATANVTFQVDMNDYNLSYGTVNLNGSFNGWCGGCAAMTDDDGDGVYQLTVELNQEETFEYKFTLDGWNAQESFVDGDPCTSTIDGFVNRTLTTGTEDATLDVVCYNSCEACTGEVAGTISVTWQVDMSVAGANPAGVFIAGGFQGWDGGASQMTDAGNGIYTYTQEVAEDSYLEWKYLNGPGWGFEETVPGACANSATNRNYQAGAEDVTIDLVCFAECVACDVEVVEYEVTFNVNMANEEVAPTGVYLAGGGNFGNPGDNQMTDLDGDGIYSITMMLDEGFSSYYTFTNGACGDWSCKENLNGLPCGDPANFNDRFLPAITGPTEISTCFGQCSTDGTCEAVQNAMVTFQVDMNTEAVTGDVTMFGSFNGWSFPGELMTDDNGDGIYEYTTELQAGGYEYKFVNSGVEESFPADSLECTLTSGAFTNRLVMVEEADLVLDAVCWESCGACDINEGDVFGCTDENANNYNSAANVDDGSCMYTSTFNVDMNCAGVEFTTVHITGPYWGWSDAILMADDDGDGVYSISLDVPGPTIEYKYMVNYWAHQEDLVDDMQNGATCAPITDYNGYANRLADSGTTTSDTYGTCLTCDEVNPPVIIDVAFAIDMNYTGFPNVDYDNIVINGSWNGWAGWGVTLADDDMDGVYTGTLALEEGTSFEFVIAATGPADGWSGWGSVFNAPAECSTNPDLPIGSGGGNYGATAAEGLTIAYCAGSCAATCPLPGCTDPFYAEFDLNATEDDGSCVTPVVFGCIYEAADNYDAAANTDDGSCEFTLNACPGDLDGDGLVATPDLLQFLSVFGTDCE